MKVKFIICILGILTAGSILLTGCSNNTGNNASSTAVISSTADKSINSTANDTVNSTVSGPLFNEYLGEIVDDIFTSTNGIYQIVLPSNTKLVTATDTTSVFVTEDGNTTITSSSEINNGPYQELTQENFEAIYNQLYTDLSTTNFTATKMNDKQTNYRFSFTANNNGSPVQVHIHKVVTDQLAITIEVSAPQDKEDTAAILDHIAANLLF